MNKKSINKKVYAVHQYLGLFVGFFIIMLSITGGMLVFSSEIDGLINPNLIKVEPSGNVKSYDTFFNDIKTRFPDAKISNVSTNAKAPEKALKAEITLNDKRTEVYYNQYTGAFLGTRVKDTVFMRSVLQFHERLLWKGGGDILVFIFGISLFFITITGIYYYRKSLFVVFKVGVRWDKNTKTVSSDLHKWVGVTSLLFNILISITGLYFYGSKLFKEEKKEAAKHQTEKVVKNNATVLDFSVQQLIEKSSLSNKYFTPEIIDLSKLEDGKILLRGNDNESNRILGKYNVVLTYCSSNQQILETFKMSNSSVSEKANRVMHELHFGQYAGWPIKLMYLLMGLAPGILSVTGFILWYKKRSKVAAKEQPSAAKIGSIVNTAQRKKLIPQPEVLHSEV